MGRPIMRARLWVSGRKAGQPNLETGVTASTGLFYFARGDIHRRGRRGGAETFAYHRRGCHGLRVDLRIFTTVQPASPGRATIESHRRPRASSADSAVEFSSVQL